MKSVCGSSSYWVSFQWPLKSNLKNFDAICCLLYWIVWQILAPTQWICSRRLSCYSSFNLCISRSTGDVHTEIICWMGFCILHFMRSKRLNSKRRRRTSEWARELMPIQLNKIVCKVARRHFFLLSIVKCAHNTIFMEIRWEINCEGGERGKEPFI